MASAPDAAAGTALDRSPRPLVVQRRCDRANGPAIAITTRKRKSRAAPRIRTALAVELAQLPASENIAREPVRQPPSWAGASTRRQAGWRETDTRLSVGPTGRQGRGEGILWE